MPFEKRFLKKRFSSQISSNPQILKRRSTEKREKKGGKAARVSSNKRGSQYFEMRKTLQLQRPVLM
jgi:hypothetical protein